MVLVLGIEDGIRDIDGNRVFTNGVDEKVCWTVRTRQADTSV